MKKTNNLLSVIAIMFISVITAHAQVKPGTIMIGTSIGSTAYSSANSDYSYEIGGTRHTATNTYSFSAGPQIGVFISSRLVLGGNLSVSYSNSSSTTKNISATQVQTGSGSSSNSLTVNLGPFARYYFSNLHANNWFYAQVNGTAGTGSGNTTGSSNNTGTTSVSNGKTSNIFNWNTGASLGMTHLFYHRIAMDFALGYNYSHQMSQNNNNTVTTNKTTGALSNSTNNYSLTSASNGISASIGFHFFLL
jgi:hypothetical protein